MAGATGDINTSHIQNFVMQIRALLEALQGDDDTRIGSIMRNIRDLFDEWRSDSDSVTDGGTLGDQQSADSEYLQTLQANEPQLADATWEEVQRDDGLLEIRASQGGNLALKQLVDLSDTKIWETATNRYTDGTRTEKETVFDDGTSRVDTFAEGLVSTSVKSDAGDAKDWDTIVSEYGEGDLQCTITTFDNGLERTALYDAGQLLAIRQEDALDAIASWTQVDRFYDTAGDLTKQAVLQDDGSARVETYANGARDGLTQFDLADSQVWETRSFVYGADGKAESRLTIYDNADKSLMLYDAGARATRYEEDGDDSETWAYRVTTYLDGTVSSVTTHDAPPPDLPPQGLADPGTENDAFTLWDTLVAGQGVHGDTPPDEPDEPTDPDGDLDDLINT